MGTGEAYEVRGIAIGVATGVANLMGAAAAPPQRDLAARNGYDRRCGLRLHCQGVPRVRD